MIPAAASSPLWGVAVLAAMLLAIRVARSMAPPAWVDRSLNIIDHPLAPWIVAIASGLFFFWLAGSTFNVPAIITDEQAYLLQAQVFARLHWSAPAPILPQFFSQLHVLLAPAIEAKYPPGQALLLAPGVAMGLPWLVPALLNAVTAGLVFALARRVAGGPTAVLTWAIWLACGSNLAWRPSYFSEITTSLLCVAGWWCALRWNETDRRLWLVLLGITIGWGAITRPYTMLLYALPLGIVVLVRIWRTRRFGDLLWVTAATLAVLAILPVWAWRSTGDWRSTPLQRYTSAYLPFDRLGFDGDRVTVSRSLPPDQRAVLETYQQIHSEHTVGSLPSAAVNRASRIAGSAWNGWRLALAPFALIGLAGLTASGMVAAGTCLLIFVGYLLYAHDPAWTLYYVELTPVLAFLAATGVWRVMRWTAGAASVVPRLALAGALPVMLALSAWEGAQVRGIWHQVHAPARLMAQRVAQASGASKLVFVRYAPDHYAHASLIANDPWFGSSRVWFAYDRGDLDTLLLRAAPDRTPYLFDEHSGILAAIQWSNKDQPVRPASPP